MEYAQQIDPLGCKDCIRLLRSGAGGSALYPPLNLLDSDQVDIPQNRVLQAGSRCSKFEGISIGHARMEAINQPGSKRIATSDAVDDVRDVIMSAEIKCFPIVKAG